jgi:RHS repeat-associated protein
VSYFHGDNLGSTRLVTKENGQVAERIRYRPFGEALQDSAAAASRYKFTGQEFDAETGLYFYGARYYDPHLGRFLSPDSVVSDQLDPQLLNRYSYVRNNPFKYTDPTGHVLVTITYVVGTVAAEAIFYSAAVAMTSYTALAIIGDWDVERGWDRTVDAGEDAYDWTDRELGVAGERLDQFGGWMGNRIEGVGASQPSHVSSGPGMMAAHSSSEVYPASSNSSQISHGYHPLHDEGCTLEVQGQLVHWNYGHYAADATNGPGWGNEVVSMRPGTVLSLNPASTAGHANQIIVRHDDGSVRTYRHAFPGVGVGDVVAGGQRLGWSDWSGYTTGPHIHLIIELSGVRVDPAPWLNMARRGTQ